MQLDKRCNLDVFEFQEILLRHSKLNDSDVNEHERDCLYDNDNNPRYKRAVTLAMTQHVNDFVYFYIICGCLLGGSYLCWWHLIYARVNANV